MARATKPPVRDPWASAASGSPDIVEAPYVDTGWPAPSLDPVKPPRGHFNFEMNRYDTALNYLMQHGIPDWDTNEQDYAVGDIVRFDAKFYVCVTTPTPGDDPDEDPDAWELWLASSMAEASAWIQEIWAWRNARKHRRFMIDHGGFDSGQIVGFDETWDMIPTVASAGSAQVVGRWDVTGTSGAGAQALQSGSSLFNGGASPQLFAMLDIASTLGLGDEVMFRHRFHPGRAVNHFQGALSFPFAASTFTDVDIALGLTDGFGISSPTSGVYFANGAVNWQAITRRNGTATVTDTGVANTANIFRRMRIDLYGSSSSDDSTARALFFIDGALVANHTANLPFGGSDLDLMTTFGVYDTNSHGSAPHLYVGPVKYRQNMWPGDVPL